MRVALISDLHASMYALESVLADIVRVGVDQIICLGDVATLGPYPVAILERLQALNCPCIMGNHDEFMIDLELIRRYTEIPEVVKAVDWCREQLSPVHLDFIRTFVRTLELDLAPELAREGRMGLPCLLYHGSPRSHMEELLASTPAEQVDEALAGFTHSVMAGGHTHKQMLRQHRGRLLVNPGSVGMPFEHHGADGPPSVMATAEYAVLEGSARGVSVQLFRLNLDPAELLREQASVAHPMRGYLMGQYQRVLPKG